MAKTIAISGKGGTGKTTLAALMVRSLLGKNPQAVLAVDADANACLGTMLGVRPQGTIADLREEVLKQKGGGGISKVDAFEMGFEQLLSESKGFDLLAMGRPEGPGCYCAANNLLRTFLDRMSNSYGYVVTDNEAGMEHLSRRTTNNVDLLAIVAEPTKIGIDTVKRIANLTRSLPISIKEVGIIWNRVDSAPDVNPDGVGVFGCVPYDKSVYDIAVGGGTVFDLENESVALKAVQTILKDYFGI
ncbi:MAG TPA: AAA family ATPase [Planctomycetes bacterium]|nr:AAA family ATPase [Planctomycetota bacterium]HIJ69822.1 AAA family ATPase [Planctomycetota bacterium]